MLTTKNSASAINRQPALLSISRPDVKCNQQTSPIGHGSGQGEHGKNVTMSAINTELMTGNYRCATGRQWHEPYRANLHGRQQLHILFCCPWGHTNRYRLGGCYVLAKTGLWIFPLEENMSTVCQGGFDHPSTHTKSTNPTNSPTNQQSYL